MSVEFEELLKARENPSEEAQSKCGTCVCSACVFAPLSGSQPPIVSGRVDGLSDHWLAPMFVLAVPILSLIVCLLPADLVEFTDEEGYGRYLDLHDCYLKYINLKSSEVRNSHSVAWVAISWLLFCLLYLGHVPT